MFGTWTYVIWLLLFVGGPLLWLAFSAWRTLWRHRRALGWMLAGALGGGWAWDVLAVQLGAWYYDPRNILNIWLGGLPLEEWLWICGVSMLFGSLTLVLEERWRSRAPFADRQTPVRPEQSTLCLTFGAWLAVFDLPSLGLGSYSQLAMLLSSGVIFHTMLWARNAAFLWSRRRTILAVAGVAELWQLVTDPIGGTWGAWYFDPHKLLGLWLFGVTPVEDLLGIALVSSAAACAALVFGHSERRWI